MPRGWRRQPHEGVCRSGGEGLLSRGKARPESRDPSSRLWEPLKVVRCGLVTVPVSGSLEVSTVFSTPFPSAPGSPLGLKLGIYEDLGNFTCMGYPERRLDKVVQDARVLAECNVDMLKLYWLQPQSPQERAEGGSRQLAGAIRQTGGGRKAPTGWLWRGPAGGRFLPVPLPQA